MKREIKLFLLIIFMAGCQDMQPLSESEQGTETITVDNWDEAYDACQLDSQSIIDNLTQENADLKVQAYNSDRQSASQALLVKMLRDDLEREVESNRAINDCVLGDSDNACNLIGGQDGI